MGNGGDAVNELASDHADLEAFVRRAEEDVEAKSGAEEKASAVRCLVIVSTLTFISVFRHGSETDGRLRHDVQASVSKFAAARRPKVANKSVAASG